MGTGRHVDPGDTSGSTDAFWQYGVVAVNQDVQRLARKALATCAPG